LLCQILSDKNMYKMIIINALITVLVHSQTMTKDNPNAGVESREKITTESIGSKYILGGKFGEIGKKHIFEATIAEHTKVKNKTITKINIVDNKNININEEITNFEFYSVGTKIKFEAIEWGELVMIDLLSNPNGNNAGQVGIRTYLKVTKVLSVEVAKDGSGVTNEYDPNSWAGNEIRNYKISYENLVKNLESKAVDNPFAGIAGNSLYNLFADAGFSQIEKTKIRYLSDNGILEIEASEKAHKEIANALGVIGSIEKSK